MDNNKWCILGNDSRSNCLREMYKKENKNMESYEKADVIIGPVPFSSDGIKINGELINCKDLFLSMKNTKKRLYTGAISEEIKDKLINENIEFYDMLKDESVAILNAIPTSEGAILAAMQMTKFTLNSSNVLVLGYGKIGKVLSKMLNGIGARVFCEARNEKDIAFIKAMGYNSVILEELDIFLPKMDIIFNTIPNLILDERRLKLLKNKCCIIDLASNPGGIDFLKAKELGINTTWNLGIPAKVAPYTSAKYLKKYIDKQERKKG